MEILESIKKSYFALLLIIISLSCNQIKCYKIDKKFRQHKVVHCNKSKVYIYYHNTPCDCISIEDDLCLDCYYQKPYRDYVEFYDNGERIHGR